MGNVYWRGGSWEVTRFTTIVRLKMEDACSFCNVIWIFLLKKSNQDKKKKALCSYQTPNGIGTIV